MEFFYNKYFEDIINDRENRLKFFENKYSINLHIKIESITHEDFFFYLQYCLRNPLYRKAIIDYKPYVLGKLKDVFITLSKTPQNEIDFSKYMKPHSLIPSASFFYTYDLEKQFENGRFIPTTFEDMLICCAYIYSNFRDDYMNKFKEYKIYWCNYEKDIPIILSYLFPNYKYDGVDRESYYRVKNVMSLNNLLN